MRPLVLFRTGLGFVLTPVIGRGGEGDGEASQLPDRHSHLGRRVVASKGARKETLYTLSQRQLGSADEKNAYWMSLVNENDRTVALRACSFVEHELLSLLRVAMIGQTTQEEEALFFRSNAVLSNFHSRIEIARAFGLITLTEYTDLNVIRRIRNTFAHAVIDITFRNKQIAGECRKLSRMGRSFTRPRRRYVNVCHSIALSFTKRAITKLHRKNNKLRAALGLKPEKFLFLTFARSHG